MSLPDEYESIRLIDLEGFSPGAKVMTMKVMEENRRFEFCSEVRL